MRQELKSVIEEAKIIAKKYRALTGKPLGITGEIGEFQAAELMGWELAEARTPGYDAIAPGGRKVQIKARCVLNGANPGQRVGSIKLAHDWDTVALILMNEDFEPLEIFEADRKTITAEIELPGSKARNERGSLGVYKFKQISRRIWPTP